MNTAPQSTLIATVAGEPSFAWDDHNGRCSIPVTVGKDDHTGYMHIAAPCSRGGNDTLSFRLGIGARLSKLPAGTQLWAQGTISAQPFRLEARRLRPQRRDVPWVGHLHVRGEVSHAWPDGRLVLELDDGATLNAMLPLDTAIAVGETIHARVLPAPKGMLPRLRNIALAGT